VVLAYPYVPAEHHASNRKERPMAEQSKERSQAEARFKKAQRATEGAQAMSEYNAERKAERAKTERLRALRLAKEAADKTAKTKQVTKKKKHPPPM
jgi:hypothetical protein